MMRHRLAVLLVLALALVGSSALCVGVARLTAFSDDQMGPVPTPGVSQPAPIRAWVPWQATDRQGITSYCVSSGAAETFPPLTQPVR